MHPFKFNNYLIYMMRCQKSQMVLKTLKLGQKNLELMKFANNWDVFGQLEEDLQMIFQIKVLNMSVPG